MTTLPSCIDLKQRFGDRYRISYDPARVKGQHYDPWLAMIEFRGGSIYPYGGSLLAVEVEGRRYIKSALARLPFTTLIQDGDHHGAFTFDVEQFDTIAEIVSPYRKRRLSPEQRERLISQLKASHATAV